MTESFVEQRLQTSLAGRYAIEREVGRGGMATVYLARDLRHDRSVAIKVLDPELGAMLGADRFLAEIKVTANLQHPNLLPLFDSGDADGLLFYVMPFVEGETLRAKLERERQLPLDEAIRIVVAVAHALNYAHGHGVIHRDLKPENILLQAGQPVVADFGIALAVSKAGGARITQTGLSLGTPQYMSPEQATGDRTVDGRADIYSLGALAYEMITGEPPHVGSTSQAIIAKLMTEAVRPLTVLRPTVSPQVDRAVRRALEKLPADRFTSANEFADALTESGSGTHATAGLTAAAGAPLRARRTRELVAWSVAALAMTALVVLAASVRGGPSSANVEANVVRVAVQSPTGVHFALRADGLAVSADGSRILYLTDGVAAGQVSAVLQNANELRGHPMNLSSRASSPVFSPDGRWIVFREGSEIKKMPAEGGPAVTIGTLDITARGMAWMRSDTIVIGSLSGLWTLAASGGTPQRMFQGDSSTGDFRWPVALSDGKTIVFVTGAATGGYTLAMAGLGDKKATLLNVPAVRALGVANGQFIYVTAAGLLTAIPIDVEHRKVSGGATPLIDSVRVDGALIGAVAVMSQSGTLLYLKGSSASTLSLVSEHSAVNALLTEPRNYAMPRFSPDGKRIAFRLSAGARSDIWVYDIAARIPTRLTTDGDNSVPEWAPDGKTIYFRSIRDGKWAIWAKPADGSGEERLFYAPDIPFNEFVLTADGKWLVYRTAPGGKHSRDFFVVSLTGDRKARALVSDRFRKQAPMVSPNGKWLAYDSDETGSVEVYVRPFPGDGPRIQVSTDGGAQPRWSPSGKELIYRLSQRGDNALMASVAVGSGDTFSTGARREIRLPFPAQSDATHPNYDIRPGTSELVIAREAGEEPVPVLVYNWTHELEEAVAKNRKP